MIMLPGNSRWIEKSIIWFWPTLKFGLYTKLMVPPWSTSGTNGLVADSVVPGFGGTTGRKPSKPTRKTDVAGADAAPLHPFGPAVGAPVIGSTAQAGLLTV